MFLDYDLAKAVMDDRRAKAAAHSLRRQARTKTSLAPASPHRGEAEVIELVFGKQCETGQIGA
ncbi:MAG TPA: hypothetical protein VMP13_08530 [Acidimicrobiia bacterium]|nr:hypothetical protein [Acidimicrobiia bacterium]